MLRGAVAFAAGESLYPHQIAVGTFVKSLCRSKWPVNVALNGSMSAR